MKQLFILSFIAISLFSCNNNESKNNKETQKIIESEKLLEDSIKKSEQLRIDSLSKIAWGDAKFGMSLKEAKNTNSFKEGYNYREKGNPYQSLKLFSSETKIDGISSIEATFFNDKLYRIDMESREQTANYWNTDIKNTILRLKKMIEDKYGSPTKNNGIPNFLDMNPDVYRTVCEWVIGDKHIIIQVGEVYNGSKYKVLCAIFHDKESDASREYLSKQYEEKQKIEKQNNGF